MGEGCCGVDRVVTPAFRFGGGWDGTKTTLRMERIADMEDDKSPRAEQTQGGGDPWNNVDKGDKGGEKECMRDTRQTRNGGRSGM